MKLLPSHSITVRHNFETAHRIPPIGGKCVNLHGHSWWAEVTAATPKLHPPGVVVDFGAFKGELRHWIDTYWDHGAILADHDELAPILEAHGKVYRMPSWPTVENVAAYLGTTVVPHILATLGHPAVCTRVTVTETHVNAATWERDQ